MNDKPNYKVVTAVNSRNKLELDKWYLSVFSDASLRGLPGKIQSAMGYMVFLSDGYVPNKETKCCILQWNAVYCKGLDYANDRFWRGINKG